MILKISIISIPLKPLQNKGLVENKNKKTRTSRVFKVMYLKDLNYSPVK